MNNNLTLSVTLTGDGRQLSGTLRDAQGDVREFSATTERESRKAETALTAPGRSATTISEHLRETQREARNFGTEATRGGREANQALAQTSAQAQTTTSHLSSLRRMVGLAFGAFSIRQIGGMVDGWSELNARVLNVTKDVALADETMARLSQTARGTYSAMSQTAEAFINNAGTLTELGYATERQLDLSDVFNNSMVISAMRGQEAATVMNSLTRAFALGELRGDQLNTVIMNGGRLTQALADGLGVATLELRDMAANGLLTTERVFDALTSQMEVLRREAEEMPATIGDGWTLIGNSSRELVGTLDRTLGASEGIAGIMVGAADAISATIDPLINNIDTLQNGITIVGVAAGAYVTYRSVLIAATAAQWAFNTAVRANPLGLAITLLGAAAGALIAYRQEVTLAGSESFQTSLDVDGLTGSFHLLTEAQQENRRASIVGDLIEMRMEAGKLGAELVEVSRLVRNSGQLTPEGGAMPIASADDIARGRELREELGTILANIGAGTDLLTEYDAIMSDLGQTTTGTATRTRALADASTASSKSAREAAAAANELTKSTEAQATALEELRNRLIPGRREVVQLADDMRTLTLAIAMGTGNVAQNIQMMGLLQQQYIEAQKDTDDLADKTVKAAFTMEGAWDEVRLNGLRRLDDGFVSLWEGAIDGSLNAGELMKKALAQTLAEMAHMAITRPITVQLATSMGFGGGASTAANAASSGGFGINPGSINNAWQAMQGGFNGIQWGGAGGAQAYGGGGFANAATQGTGATGFMGGSMQNFSGMQGLAGLGAGFAGNYLGGQLFGQGSQSNTLGAVGGIAGTYLGGPIGALLGSGLGSALGGLFGGRKWNETGSGVNLGVSGGDITGNQFSDQHSKGGLFRSSRRRTRTSALDGEFSSALQEVYDATEQSLAATIEVLGFQSSALTGFTTGLTRIDTKGLSAEDAEAKIQEWLSNTLNALAIHSVGDVSQYAMGGETTLETVERLAVALGTLNPILEQLHGSTLAASMAGGSAASHLADLAGGIDAFSARADFYYQNVLTETERQERAMAAAAQAMGAFTARTGQVINSTDALRDLVDGIDLATASGRELYNEAMNLAPALVEIERGLERVGQRFDQMLQEAESALASAEQQARRAWQTFDQQQFGMQAELLALMGDAEGALALERERELATIDESLRPMRERIWAMQDEITVQQNATTAARNYQRELSRVRDQLNQQLANIGNWLDQQQATSGSPEMNLATAQEQLARQLVLIENDDRNALQSITQYADRVLEANQAYNASSAAGQRIQEDVYDAIRALPDAITAEEYLAEEIRNALFDALDGKATNDELQALMTRVANGDMTLEAALKQVYGVSEGTEANTESLEKQAHDQLRELNGLVGEMTRTTDQFVGLNSTMVSLKDSINALGVAQEEIARIEKERVAAEKAERERIERERRDTVAAQRKEMSGELSSLKSLYSDYQEVIKFNQDPNATGSTTQGGLAEHYKYHSNVRKGASSLDDLLSGSYAYNYRPDLNTSKRVNQLLGEYNNAVQGIGSVESEIERLMASLNNLPKFASGGVFTNSVVSSPTHFDMGLMGEAGPEAIVPLHMGSEGLGIKDYSTRAPSMGAASLPSFPLLGNNEVFETLRDLKREVAELRRDSTQLQSESNKHLAAANNQRGAAAKGQIGAIERGNKMLKRMEDDKRLEAAKR